MNENENSNNEEQSLKPEVPEVTPSEQSKQSTSTEPEKQPRKKSQLWQWLMLFILVVALGIFVTATPAINRYLPWSPSNSTHKSSSSSYTGFCDLGGARAGTCGPMSTSNQKAETAMVSYASFTLAMPIMIAVLTFLTLLNTLMFMSMTISLNNIKTAIADIYNKSIDEN